jgi:hypothetical protein
MKNIYQVVALSKQSLFQRIFRQLPPENSIKEINNLFATKEIREIKQSEIQAISKTYKVNFDKRYRKNLIEFYAVYLNRCLADKLLTESEITDLEHIKGILNLSDNEVEQINNELTGKIYKNELASIIADGLLDENEEQHLEKLQHNIRIPDDLAKKISAEMRRKFIKDFVKKAISDDRFSPDEEKELELLAKNLKVDLKIDEYSRTLLDKLKLYWHIENGDLEPVEVDISLQKNELCYFTTDVDWHEQRTVTQRINYAGPTARVRIMKGVYYRAGSIKPQAVRSDEWRLIDSGRIFLTNKRLIFMGRKKNTNIRLNRILSFTPYSDGIDIQKDAGRSPLIAFNENVEIMGMLLSRLMKEL